ncbi:hypothetical protein AB0L34_19470 [Micromonospora sp. NPDC052213]|uniref:hypothetical protein n=1 Tax=Micromonospora sp. NPDC052213 TaxID=3155812 RepID=UPI00342D02FA
MKTVEVLASYDGGATWRGTIVEPEDGGFQVGVRNPDSGFVSLRIRAQDDRGNAVEQTLIRAYAVRWTGVRERPGAMWPRAASHLAALP